MEAIKPFTVYNQERSPPDHSLRGFPKNLESLAQSKLVTILVAKTKVNRLKINTPS
jgi:hypothetical protein